MTRQTIPWRDISSSDWGKWYVFKTTATFIEFITMCLSIKHFSSFPKTRRFYNYLCDFWISFAIFFSRLSGSALWRGVHTLVSTHTVDITASVSDLFWGQSSFHQPASTRLTSVIWHCWGALLKKDTTHWASYSEGAHFPQGVRVTEELSALHHFSSLQNSPCQLLLCDCVCKLTWSCLYRNVFHSS